MNSLIYDYRNDKFNNSNQAAMNIYNENNENQT